MATDRHWRRHILCVVGIAGVVGHGAPAHADMSDLANFAPTGFAPAGTDVRLGDIRGFIDGLGASSPEERTFTFTPALGVQELLTDNVYQITSPRRADLVTSINPELALSGNTRRIEANIYYAPSVQLYARTPQQNQVVQNFNGESLLTAIPDTLFLQLRGYGTQQAGGSNYAQNGSPYNSSVNRVNTIAYEVSPYVTHRFGGDGTIRAGYTLNYTSQTGSTPGTNGLNGFASGPYGQGLGNGTTLSNEEYATFTTGENFGRFNDSLRLDATQYSGSGSGVLSRAYRNTAIDDFGYGITRAIALLGSVGWEDIFYSGTPAFVVRDAVWSGGVRLTPNEDSVLVVKYGHKDGFNALQLSASYAVTARLRVFANYSAGLTTSQEDLANNLDASTVDQYGNTISTATGAPSLVADQLLALQNDLYRLKRFSLTGVSTYDRDVFSLTLEQETQQLVLSAPGVAGFSNRGESGSLSWSHQLTPEATTTASLRYAHSTAETVPVSSTDSVGVFLQAGYAISPTLTGTVQYFFTKQSVSGAQNAQILNALGQSYTQNAIIFGLRKSL